MTQPLGIPSGSDDGTEPHPFDFWILNVFTLSTIWLLMSTLTSMFLMMATKEVGDAEVSDHRCYPLTTSTSAQT